MKDDGAYLQHIQEAIGRVRDYTIGGKEAFLLDTRTQDAVIRNLEVIGEAAKRLSEQSRRQHLQFRGSKSPACAISSSITISAYNLSGCGKSSSEI